MSDKSVVDQIKHYQRDIIKCPDNTKRMIRCIERLMVLPVTIAHLQSTGVGRSVNELRKCGGEVGAAANALVCKWKSMVQAEDDSDVESEVEENEPKETVQVSSPDIIVSSPHISESVDKSKNEPVDKHKKTHNSEELRKPKSDHGSKKSESSHSDLKRSDNKKSDKHDHKSDRSKSSKSEPGYGSDFKHSSRHQSKSDSKSNQKSHSSHRSETECNGDTKTERPSSKTKLDETKLSKSSSVESKNKDVKQKNDKDKHRRENSPHRREKENRRREEGSHRGETSSSSKKYDVRRIESESSDDDSVYKPRSKKRKKSESEENQSPDMRCQIKSESDEDHKPQIRGRIKSESEEDQKHNNDKYSKRRKHRDSKRHESSDDSDERDGSEEEEISQPSSRNSESRNESDNEEEMSGRSSPNNMSDNEVESDKISSPGDAENEDSHSDKTSDSDESEIYVPTKIKREKESPPRQSYTPSNKSKSSQSRSSHTSTHHSSTGNHSSTHNSKSAKNDKESSSKKESFENMKIKKENDKNEDSKKRREEKTSDKKSYKPSSSHSHSSSKESSKTEKKVKIKIEKEVDGSIDCVSGASFADALMGLSEPKKKSAKRKSTPSTPEKPSKSVEKPADGKSKSLIKTEPHISSSSSSSSKTSFKEPELLSKNIKLEPLDVDLKATLPEISPHYKPLPHYSPPSSPLGKRTKLLSQEEALSTIMSTKNQRTKVYSGNKSGYLKVPSLFDLCIQVLRDNIEALEYTGGVPYDLLKPVLDRATASQLFQLEHYNPYLVEDTDGLWKFHCNKDFRGKEPDEFESWRELYVRLLDERERKLEALKANITQSMAKNTPVRQTKLAYVDSVVKPPRNIAKKQMKFGTGKAVKHELVSKAMVGAASSSPAPVAVPVPAPPSSARSSHPNAFPIPNFLKKKKAPLMQKTLQLIKGNRFKR